MKFTYTHTRRACYIGYITQAIVNNLAPVLFIVFQNQFGLSYNKLGGLILINFVTQLVVDILAIRSVDRLGYRGPMIFAHVCAAAGLILLGFLPACLPDAYAGLAVSVVLYAVGGGLLEVLVSPVVDSLPTPEGEKASTMSLLHSFYCWGQVGVVVFSTLLLRVIGFGSWQFLPIVWAAVPFFSLFLFMRVPMAPALPREERMNIQRLFSLPAFLGAMLLMLLAGASELTMSQWSSMFAEQGLGLPKVWGDLAGPAMFALFMGIGRTVYGIWGKKLRLERFMLGSGVLCIVCYLFASLSGNPAVSLIFCAVCGISVSLLWPGTFSLASVRFPLGGAAMFGLLAMSGDMGAAVGPWLAGIFADNAALYNVSGLKMGILSGTAFPLLLVILLPVFIRKKPAEKENVK